jgi:regulation of enolase protein 1 (concanavalin A-like superfamily)
MATIRVPAVPLPFVAEGEADWQIAEDAVITFASARSDFFIDPGYTAVADAYTRLNADRLLARLPEGDFQFSAEVVVDFVADFDAGVLLLWSDDRHWAKLCFEYSREKQPLIVSVVTRDYADDANAFVVEVNRVWLRIARMAHIVAFHASDDGVSWRMVRVFTFGPDFSFTHAGFLAQSPNGEGCAVGFENIRYSNDLPADIRAGA